MSDNSQNPRIKVSAVIPTRNRPTLVCRAVRTALAQSLSDIEIIVVVDGQDPPTMSALEAIADPRLRIVQLPQSTGAPEARNRGALEAKGEWVAFLDDDDEWLPEKLEKQLRAAEKSRFRNPIVSCQFFARTPKGEYVWPRRIPEPGEPISDYLFARRSFFQGEGFVTTTTLLARRRLVVETPFDKDLRRHQDADWVLRSLTREDVGMEYVQEALAVWYGEDERQSIGNTDDWRYSLDWIRRSRSLVTKRAYSGFLLTALSACAANARDRLAIRPLLKEAFKLGRPSLTQLLLFPAPWIIPREGRRWLRSIFLARSRYKSAEWQNRLQTHA